MVYAAGKHVNRMIFMETAENLIRPGMQQGPGEHDLRGPVNVLFYDRLIDYAFSALFAVSASLVKPSASVIAISARTLRLRSMLDFLRPYINLL